MLEGHVSFSPRVVVVAAADEDKIYAALQHRPYAQRPRVKKQNGRLVLDKDPDLFQDLSDDDYENLKGHCQLNEPSSTSVAEAPAALGLSTTQMRGLAIGNPRAKAPRLHE